MDDEKCEKLEICGFFNEYKGCSNMAKEAWVISYCENLENSKNCMRKKYFKVHGVAPVLNMSPSGRLL